MHAADRVGPSHTQGEGAALDPLGPSAPDPITLIMDCKGSAFARSRAAPWPFVHKCGAQYHPALKLTSNPPCPSDFGVNSVAE
jgi:hypothetical protein